MGVGAEFACEADGRQPAEAGAVGEGVDLADEALDECGKRLSAPLWASEDLASSSQPQRGHVASRGSPEWSGAADSQRAISLDASECLAETSNPALVRSSALEDLRAIGDKSSWEDREGEEPFCEEPAQGAVPAPCRPTQHLAQLDVEPAADAENISQKAAGHSEGAAAVNGDVCRDSESRGASTPRSSPARKSLVPVPVSKGLFAVTLPELSALLQFHRFSLERSCSCVLCCTFPSENPTKGA